MIRQKRYRFYDSIDNKFKKLTLVEIIEYYRTHKAQYDNLADFLVYHCLPKHLIAKILRHYSPEVDQHYCYIELVALLIVHEYDFEFTHEDGNPVIVIPLRNASINIHVDDLLYVMNYIPDHGYGIETQFTSQPKLVISWIEVHLHE